MEYAGRLHRANALWHLRSLSGAISLDVFYRVGDAAVLNCIFEMANYSMGMSYDFTVSSLSAVSKYRGGAEVLIRVTDFLEARKK